MGYLLSFVYVNAWTSQFFVGQSDGLESAKALSASILSWSMVIGLAVGALLGHFIDNCRIWPILLLCFVFRGIGLLSMTCLLTDFET